ncbi:hypothetical protein [Psychrobacter sp. H7-1]|uniref:hypothetical protein n=1 Tax=Psychrobacter sp. H7-1 TaxID=1569265 RepID=UPI00191A82F5|nr:hypothetical protein [Psychrobacter sp. H7-1]
MALELDGFDVVVTMCDRTQDGYISGEVYYLGEYITIPVVPCDRNTNSDDAMLEQLSYVLNERQLEKEMASQPL